MDGVSPLFGLASGLRYYAFNRPLGAAPVGRLGRPLEVGLLPRDGVKVGPEWRSRSSGRNLWLCWTACAGVRALPGPGGGSGWSAAERGWGWSRSSASAPWLGVGISQLKTFSALKCSPRSVNQSGRRDSCWNQWGRKRNSWSGGLGLGPGVVRTPSARAGRQIATQESISLPFLILTQGQR